MLGIKDLDREILLKIDCHTLFLEFSTLNKYFYSLFDEILYRKKVKLYFPNTKNKENLTYRKLYLYNVSLIKKLKETYKFTFKSGDPKKYIKILSQPKAFQYHAYYIARYGYEDLLNIIYPQDYDISLSGAAHSGNTKLVHYFINLGASDYNLALYSAIRHNHRPLIDIFLPFASDWQDFLSEAEDWGHTDLIKLFKSKI